MVRDLDLVRKILQHFEDKSDWNYEENQTFEGYDDKIVSYHIDIIYEAGLINGEPVRSKQGRLYDVLPFRLTWEGHEFLDNVKDRPRWVKIKSLLADKGGNFSFDLVKKLAIKIAWDKLTV